MLIHINDLIINQDETEDLLTIDGYDINLPSPYYLPYPIYIIASMNSVDRAIAPLDSALSRRFKKIEYATDYKVLGDLLNVNIQSIDFDNPNTWDVSTVAYLLLIKVNNFVLTRFSKDFEIGHAYLLPVQNGVNEAEKLDLLRECWEGSVIPQIKEIFSNRDELLRELLKVGQSNLPNYYPYKLRTSHLGELDILGNDNTFILNDFDKLLDVFRILAI